MDSSESKEIEDACASEPSNLGVVHVDSASGFVGDTANEVNAESSGKKKLKKEEKPPTKVVIRRLPPTMEEEAFLQAVSPLPEHDHFEYIKSDLSLGPHSFSRCYINFLRQEDVFTFTETFDQYVFLGAKGQEYPAIVEYAPFQRIPRAKPKKKDPSAGTIDNDPAFMAFKKMLEEEAEKNAKAPANGAGVQSYVEAEPTPNEAAQSTPLLDFLKQKKAEKARIREEKREERKRKEQERKMRQQSSKEKKSDSHKDPEDDENTPQGPIRLLQPKDRRDRKRETEKTDFDRKLVEKDKNQRFKKEDRGLKENKLPPRSKEIKSKNDKNYAEDKGRKRDDKKKDAREDSRKKPMDLDDAPDDVNRVGEASVANDAGSSSKRRCRGDKNKSNAVVERERKRLQEFMARKVSRRKNCGTEDGVEETTNAERVKFRVGDLTGRRNEFLSNQEELTSGHPSSSSKRRSSLESGEIHKVDERLNGKRRNSDDSGKSKNICKETPDIESAAEYSNSQPSKSSVKNGKSGKDETKGDRKDPRTDRRIRNKDRPSIQIYRPGMGKFSKQRLEKEKALGSSTEMESPSHSPSPTPKTNFKFNSERP